MKKSTLLILSLLFLSFATYADEQDCRDGDTCAQIQQDEENFYNADITEAQADNAFALSDELMGNIGRSIAGEFEQ